MPTHSRTIPRYSTGNRDRSKEVDYKHEAAIDILRGITFLLVLFGHSFPDSAYEYISPVTEYLHDFIYSFHMPLFFFISGFCMLHVLVKNELDLALETKKRALRLMVPYFFWSYIAIIPKVLFSSLMYLPYDRSQLFEVFLGNSPSGTLWYLWTLFLVNVLYLLVSRISRDWRVWLGFGFVLYAISRIWSIPFFGRVLRYQFWFVVGCSVSVNWSCIAHRMPRMVRFTPLIILVNCFIVYLYKKINISLQGNIVSTLICGSALLCISVMIRDSRGRITSFLNTSSRYSYPIYLLSPWVQVGIRVFLYAKLGFPYLVCMILMFVLGYCIPYLLIVFSLKCHVKQYKGIALILGI